MLKENINIIKYPKPSFSENNIPIVFASNGVSAYLLVIAIQSIISNSSDNNNYDIFILYSGVPPETKAIIEQIMGNKDNFHLKYIYMEPYLQDVDKYLLELTCKEYSLAVWFRIFIPRIFKHFDKVIYLDCDVVLLCDISELFHTNMHGHAVAACGEFGMGEYHTYVTQVLHLNDSNNYFNSGVLVFDINNKFNKTIENKCVKALLEVKNPECPDQDILNMVYENNVEYLDIRWNARWMREERIENLEPIERESLKKAYASPKLVHYAGVKPINAVDNSFGQYFWKYAEQTPLYMFLRESLLAYLVPYMQSEDITMGKDPALDKMEKTLWKYYALSKITHGEEREKYDRAYYEYWALLEKMGVAK